MVAIGWSFIIVNHIFRHRKRCQRNAKRNYRIPKAQEEEDSVIDGILLRSIDGDHDEGRREEAESSGYRRNYNTRFCRCKLPIKVEFKGRIA